MNLLPDPVISDHDGFLVVRDDLLPGGTKRRAISVLFDEHEEYVYPSPVFGYAQLALAYAARDAGKKAVVFCAKRKVRHHLTLEAEQAGATIHEISPCYLNVVRARAREYCDANGARLLPFGLDTPVFVDALARVACSLPVKPTEVWTVVGSGVLTRALQQAWPQAKFFGVRVGKEPRSGRAAMYLAPEGFEQEARYPPPFPSCSHYDAKVWYFVKQFGSPGALIWNVAK